MGVDNTHRRKWNREEYLERARERELQVRWVDAVWLNWLRVIAVLIVSEFLLIRLFVAFADFVQEEDGRLKQKGKSLHSSS